MTLAQVQDAMTQTAEGIKSAPAVLELARATAWTCPSRRPW
ncbi:hypothetical protein QJS66_00785 [Kocuria rhizophila]|nr:hypothetical protein QJS66_00785 [Kocuria rhizophila]